MTDTYVDPDTLRDDISLIVELAGGVVQHGADSDDRDELTFLLADLRDAKQTLADAYDTVQRALVACAGDKQFVVEGIGMVEVKKSVSRKQWDHESLLRSLRPHLLFDPDGDMVTGEEALARVGEVYALHGSNARLHTLRAYGIQVDEFCQETWGDQGIKLPRPVR